VFLALIGGIGVLTFFPTGQNSRFRDRPSRANKPTNSL
jgi:hypothetical protein